MSIRPILLSLLLTFPLASAATPVAIEVLSDPETDTGYFGDIGSCGFRLTCQAAGTLFADMDGDLMSGVHGDIFIRGIGVVSVTGGVLDFGGAGNSWFMTDELGGFSVGSMGLTDWGLYFNASSWNKLCQSWRCKQLRLRFWGRQVAMDDTSVPEPNAALLFGLGAVAIGRRVRRT